MFPKERAVEQKSTTLPTFTMLMMLQSHFRFLLFWCNFLVPKLTTNYCSPLKFRKKLLETKANGNHLSSQNVLRFSVGVRTAMERCGFYEKMPKTNLYLTVHDAFVACLQKQRLANGAEP